MSARDNPLANLFQFKFMLLSESREEECESNDRHLIKYYWTFHYWELPLLHYTDNLSSSYSLSNLEANFEAITTWFNCIFSQPFAHIHVIIHSHLLTCHSILSHWNCQFHTHIYRKSNYKHINFRHSRVLMDFAECSGLGSGINVKRSVAFLRNDGSRSGKWCSLRVCGHSIPQLGGRPRWNIFGCITSEEEEEEEAVACNAEA